MSYAAEAQRAYLILGLKTRLTTLPKVRDRADGWKIALVATTILQRVESQWRALPAAAYVGGSATSQRASRLSAALATAETVSAILGRPSKRSSQSYRVCQNDRRTEDLRTPWWLRPTGLSALLPN